MLRISLAVLVAVVIAALVALATEPVAATGAPQPRAAAKGDRLDLPSRADCARLQAGAFAASRPCRRDGVAPARAPAEVRVARGDVRPIRRVAHNTCG
jgi:hypothetical protein